MFSSYSISDFYKMPLKISNGRNHMGDLGVYGMINLIYCIFLLFQVNLRFLLINWLLVHKLIKF